MGDDMTKPVPTAGVRLSKKVPGKPFDGAARSKNPNLARSGGIANSHKSGQDYSKKGK
jgi:hypothetical protein